MHHLICTTKQKTDVNYIGLLLLIYLLYNDDIRLHTTMDLTVIGKFTSFRKGEGERPAAIADRTIEEAIVRSDSMLVIAFVRPGDCGADLYRHRTLAEL